MKVSGQSCIFTGRADVRSLCIQLCLLSKRQKDSLPRVLKTSVIWSPARKRKGGKNFERLKIGRLSKPLKVATVQKIANLATVSEE